MQKKKNSEKKKFQKKIFFLDFFLQNHEIWPQTESRNSRDHELWNHEMRGAPVFESFVLLICFIQSIFSLILCP